MACTGHTAGTACTAHTNVCSAHAGYIGPIAQTVFTDPTLGTSINVRIAHHNELRTAITSELIRRTKTWPADPGAVSTSNSIGSVHVRKLRDGLNAAVTWTWPTSLSDVNTGTDDNVLSQQYTALRTQTNILQAQCICDCNYACTCLCNYACTCNCNYACTCNCNYCTCNCNYCTCNCNYSCTCNCNYSCTCQCNYSCTCNCAYACTCNCNHSCVCNCNY